MFVSRHIGMHLAMLLVAGSALTVPPAAAQDQDVASLLLRIGEHRTASIGAAETLVEPVLMLYLRTARDYPCYNYRINAQFSQSGSVLDLTVNGVELGKTADGIEICQTLFGPARYSTDLDLPDGTYTLRLSHLGQIDEYELQLNSDHVNIAAIVSEVSAFDSTLYWRLPRQSFTFRCGTLTQDAFLCDEFEQILLSSLPITPIAVPSEGEWPYSLSSSGHHYDAPARFFYYEQEDDFLEAGELLAAYTEEVLTHRRGKQLVLTNWRSEQFSSFEFER